MQARKVALVTGANKGIGFEIVRQLARQGLTVLLGARDGEKGNAAAHRLRDEGLDVQFLHLDQTQAPSIAVAVEQVSRRSDKLDILVNNAGILLDQGVVPSALDADALRKTLETNVVGVAAVTRAFLALLRKSEAARIVNVSSSGGSLGQIAASVGIFAPAYQISKAALNGFTVLLANELKGTPIKVNSACPGWVRTDMGGPGAPLTPDQGADTPVWLATLPADGPSGGFFNSRQPVPW
ncbi:short-chain dehydrogenase [Planctomycetaceae bacterium SCGC AG-212-F19]|nr:short-chain dehydrogenase [Planctomycetaceae bacterium SCGC AG-212-F19]